WLTCTEEFTPLNLLVDAGTPVFGKTYANEEIRRLSFGHSLNNLFKVHPLLHFKQHIFILFFFHCFLNRCKCFICSDPAELPCCCSANNRSRVLLHYCDKFINSCLVFIMTERKQCISL